MGGRIFQQFRWDPGLVPSGHDFVSGDTTSCPVVVVWCARVLFNKRGDFFGAVISFGRIRHVFVTGRHVFVSACSCPGLRFRGR